MKSAALTSPGALPDATEWRCFLLSAAGHGLALVLLLGWGSMWQWLLESAPSEAAAPEESAPRSTKVVYATPNTTPTIPRNLPSLPSMPPPKSEGIQPLRPRLDTPVEGRGPGSDGGAGDIIESPDIPPALALPLPPQEQQRGGGSPVVEQRLRQEQEANYLLMGFLLRQYREHWKPIYGHRLPRGTIYLWIEHDNSRVMQARFSGGSSTGIPELDAAITAWLVAENHIDLSDLRQSESPLLMSVDLYQAHR